MADRQPQPVILIDAVTGEPAVVDADGNLQTEVNNTVDVNVVSGVSGGGVLDSDLVTFNKITATSTTLIDPATTDAVLLHRIYVTPDSDGIPCQWYFQFGSGTAFCKTWFSSIVAYRDFKWGSGSSDGLQGDDNENLTFIVDRTNSNLLVTVVYSFV